MKSRPFSGANGSVSHETLRVCASGESFFMSPRSLVLIKRLLSFSYALVPLNWKYIKQTKNGKKIHQHAVEDNELWLIMTCCSRGYSANKNTRPASISWCITSNLNIL